MAVPVRTANARSDERSSVNFSVLTVPETGSGWGNDQRFILTASSGTEKPAYCVLPIQTVGYRTVTSVVIGSVGDGILGLR